MPQWVHDAASVIQIVFAVGTVLGLMATVLVVFKYHQSWEQWIEDRIAGLPSRSPDDPPALTATQILNEVWTGLGEEVSGDSLQEEILNHLERRSCIQKKEDREAELACTLHWRDFFNTAPDEIWNPCATKLASKLLDEGITHIAVLPWPRESGNASYDSFTRELVDRLGGRETIIVDHVLESTVQSKTALSQFHGARGQPCLIFEPYEVDDGYLMEAIDYLISVHGCDIKALVTFFKTNTKKRSFGNVALQELQVVKLRLK